MKFKFNYYWLLVLAPLGLIFWYLVAKKEAKPLRYLAYFGPKNALKANDTTYHYIPPFVFTDQFGEPVNQDSTRNKIVVADFFFTTCGSICPIMSTNLERVYKEFKNTPGVLILSHTVDPETDSVEALAAYARLHGATDRRWLFLTGDKPRLYEVARKGYLLNAEEGNGGADDFIHTQNFALVDKEHHIRGFYDGTDSREIDRLIREIRILLKEYDYKADHS
jgi:protein SCO1/2